jgi:hypothetical protein
MEDVKSATPSTTTAAKQTAPNTVQKVKLQARWSPDSLSSDALLRRRLPNRMAPFKIRTQ